MYRSSITFALVTALLGARAPASFAQGAAENSAEVRPLLAKYCFDCHNDKKHKGGVNLTSFSEISGKAESRPLLKKVWGALHGQEMPPEDQPQPTPAERERLISWLDAARQPAPGTPRDPGRPVLRRLTRTEYSNTICDLLPSLRPPGPRSYFDPAKGFPAEGVQLGLHVVIERSRVPVVELPPDDVDHGFDNIGEVLTLSPLLMDRYLAVATEVLDKAQAKKEPRLAATPADRGKPPGEVARRIIATFASGAFRRPVSDREVENFLKLFDLATQRGDTFDAAIKAPLQAILISPHFLFKIERDGAPASDAATGPRPVGEYELASRLSYFLWSTMPDEELLELARKGTLHDPEVFQAQVRRMLKSPKAKAMGDNFAVQWLGLSTFETAMPDPQLFPIFFEDGYQGIRYCMRQEAILFFEVLMMEDRSVLEFIDADWAILNAGLAQIYGVDKYSGRVFTYGKEVPRKEYETWKRYKLPDHRRGGVLTMAGVLTSTSAPTRTSPVIRGHWVLENILGMPPPPPPPNAGVLKEEGPEILGLTMRQRLDRHRADPACASCHRRMDPIGFALENYDPIGRWREKEGPFPPRDGEQTWEFNAAPDFEGWSGAYQHGALDVRDGKLCGTGPNMTYLFSPRLDKDAGTLNQVSIRIKNGTDCAKLQLSYVRAADGDWTEAGSAKWGHTTTMSIEPHADFKEYTFDMSKAAGWAGRISGIRLELPKAVGEYQIDWIRIASKEPGGPSASKPIPVDARATLPGGITFSGPAELKAALLATRKDDFVRCLAEHMMTYALGRKMEDEDAPVIRDIVRAVAKDGYKFSTLVLEVAKSYPFQYRRATETNHE